MKSSTNSRSPDFWRQAIANHNNKGGAKINLVKKTDKPIENARGNVERVLNISNIDVRVDYEKQSVVFFTKDGESIGEMFLGEFIVLDERLPHCFLEIRDKFKGRGYGELLFNTYKEHFGALEFEYTKLKSKFKFFLKIGYKPYSRINPETGEEEILYGDEEEALIAIENGDIIKMELE